MEIFRTPKTARRYHDVSMSWWEPSTTSEESNLLFQKCLNWVLKLVHISCEGDTPLLLVQSSLVYIIASLHQIITASLYHCRTCRLCVRTMTDSNAGKEESEAVLRLLSLMVVQLNIVLDMELSKEYDILKSQTFKLVFMVITPASLLFADAHL